MCAFEKYCVYCFTNVLNGIFESVITVSIPVQSHLSTRGLQNLLNPVLITS